MEKKHIGAQIYGYAICLTAVITFLICIGDLVSALIDNSDPLNARGLSPSLTSYENFKVNTLSAIPKESTYIPDDQAIREMYEAARDNKISNVKHSVRKSLITSTLLIVVSLVLFGIHWKWLQRIRRGGT